MNEIFALLKKYRIFYIILILFFIIVSISFFIYQKQNYAVSILMHSSLFPYEAITNVTEPIIIATKNREIEKITKTLHVEERIVKKIHKLDYKKISGMTDKIQFNGNLYLTEIRMEELDKNDIDTYVKSLNEYITSNKSIESQLEIERKSVKERYSLFDSTLNQIDNIQTVLLTNMKDNKSVNVDIGKMFESKVLVIKERQISYEKLSRLRDGIDIISISEAYPIKKISLPILLIASLMIANFIFILYIGILNSYKKFL